VLIDSVQAVRALAAEPRQARVASWVQVRLPGFPEDENTRFQREVERYGTACGCDTGATAVLLSLAAFAVGWPAAGFPGGIVAGVLGALVALLAGGALGKAWGLMRARRRFDRAVQGVLARLEHTAHAAPRAA
jgi:hypothetical protein